jgi:hypothetical protein
MPEFHLVGESIVETADSVANGSFAQVQCQINVGLAHRTRAHIVFRSPPATDVCEDIRDTMLCNSMRLENHLAPIINVAGSRAIKNQDAPCRL